MPKSPHNEIKSYRPADAGLFTHKTAFRRAVIGWFRRNARPLPWRGTTDPYAVWVAEIALQQTRVEQGGPYIARFLKAFPTVQALAAAPEDRVLKVWEGLGYYARARNLYRAARAIVFERGGAFPETAEAWLELPGVGRYTAGAIASIAFGEPAPVLDGNVKRVLARLLDLDAPLDSSPATQRLWEIMEELVEGRAPGDFNQGMMELGARVCTTTQPACGSCPVRRYCAAFAKGTVPLRPVRRAKRPVPHREVVVAAIRQYGRYLLGKRPARGLLGGLWEFPGGKVRPGEPRESALAREVREELGVRVKIGDLVATVDHAYSHFRVTLHVYRCELVSGAPQARSHTELKWVAPKDFPNYAFPKANHKFLRLLK